MEGRVEVDELTDTLLIYTYTYKLMVDKGLQHD